MRGAHDDAVLLTAALLLFWTVNEKQASDIGARTAWSLLRREGGDENLRALKGRKPRLNSLFLTVLRHEIAADRHRDGSYGSDLDSLVAALDNMTERRVVPGRVFTPSTLHGRDDLLLSVLAILLSVAPDEGDDGIAARVTELARNEELLPEGDLSLRNVLQALGSFRTSLETPWPQVDRGIALLAPECDAGRATEKLGDIVRSAQAVIDAERLKRLEARPVDLDKIEEIRVAIEAALLKDPAQPLFFRDVRVERGACEEGADLSEVRFQGIAKAELIEPPMAPTVLGFDELLMSGSLEDAERRVWIGFAQRPRTEVTVGAKAELEAFWGEIAEYVEQVGPEPVLVLSRNAEGRVLRRFGYGLTRDRPNLMIERRPDDESGGAYIATVEGVDVFGADFTPGVAWLFSARALRRIRYGELDVPGRFVDVSFDLGEETKGTLRVRFR